MTNWQIRFIVINRSFIYKIFKVSALDAMFRFFDDEAEAVQTLWQ